MRNNSITSESSREYLLTRGYLKTMRYLRRNHDRRNHADVFNLMVGAYPDEGKKLVENFDLDEYEKRVLLIKFLIFQKQITCLILGDQRMGKDATICKIFEDIMEFIKFSDLDINPRFVTLGNVRNPPFVKESDMYFSFKKIPSGTEKNPVFIYCSELESILPARDTMGQENKLYAQLEGTLAQNHQKLFGAVKLTSKVDINVIRSCNVKIFKYISKDKLEITNVERDNFLTELGRWLLPSDFKDKSRTLLCFNNYLLTLNYELPDWWDNEYSEQFKNVSKDKVFDYIDSLMIDTEKLTPAQITTIQTAVFQKFRVDLTKKEIFDYVSI